MNQPMRFISAFSGVGGMDMGLENAGMECVAQIEWDKHCQNVLRHHWPAIPKWHDITTVNGADLPDAEVFAFGSPCQDLSLAGKRAGIEGARSSMFFEALRIIKEKQNATGTIRSIIWENVAGALSSNRGKDFGTILDALAELGIVEIEWAILDARWYGIPQRRRRVFLVAQFHPATSGSSRGEILPVRAGKPRDFTKGRKKRQADPRTTLDSIDDGCESNDDAVISNVSSKWAKGTGGPSGDECYNLVPVAYSIREDATANTFSVTQTETALAVNALQPSTQSHHAQIFIAQPIVFENSFRDGIRLGEQGVTQTLSAKMGTGGLNTPMVGQAHQEKYAVRRLTPLECERLQGWKDNHTAVGADGKTISDTQRFKMIGNGVASPVAEWVGKCVIEAYKWTEHKRNEK
jgi:DNA (cytosine-5)-methyltransferase 1